MTRSNAWSSLVKMRKRANRHIQWAERAQHQERQDDSQATDRVQAMQRLQRLPCAMKTMPYTIPMSIAHASSAHAGLFQLLMHAFKFCNAACQLKRRLRTRKA